MNDAVRAHLEAVSDRSRSASSKRCGRARAGLRRDLQPQFPGVAYTTLMTTLDRLFREGTLTRVKSGRAFYYTPKAPSSS